MIWCTFAHEVVLVPGDVVVSVLYLISHVLLASGENNENRNKVSIHTDPRGIVWEGLPSDTWR